MIIKTKKKTRKIRKKKHDKKKRLRNKTKK